MLSDSIRAASRRSGWGGGGPPDDHGLRFPVRLMSALRIHPPYLVEAFAFRAHAFAVLRGDGHAPDEMQAVHIRLSDVGYLVHEVADDLQSSPAFDKRRDING